MRFFLIAIWFLLTMGYIGVCDVFVQSHNVNTSIESCATHLLRKDESQSQSEKNAQCERIFKTCKVKKLSTLLNYSSNSSILEKFVVCQVYFCIFSHLGRTIKDFLMYTLTIPCLYSFLWFCVFGGVAVKMENLARQANLTCDSPLGGKTSTESFNGLYLLSCR